MRRICLRFSCFVLFFAYVHSLFVLCALLSFFALVVFLCPLALSLWLFGCGCCFLFPFGLYAKRKGAPCWCVLSCPAVCLLCEIGLSVLVKFVFVSLNCFGYTFVGGGVFAIVLPLLEKTFKNTIDKFPCVKFVFYALIYIV